jgi:hypothetical protein
VFVHFAVYLNDFNVSDDGVYIQNHYVFVDFVVYYPEF